jgi:pimeloyl-ACP methyl ester carboxylesterase
LAGKKDQSRSLTAKFNSIEASKMNRPALAIGFVFVVALFSVTAYIAIKPSVLRLLSFYCWKIVAHESHGGGYAKCEDVSIYYETFGSGPPVLVLHGGLGSLEDMGYQIRGLAQSHFVIAADSRGHGRSSDSDKPLSYSSMADDMFNLLKQLGVSSADVVGWSDGGIIALDLAMRYPSSVRRIVAISANYDPSGISQPPEVENNVPSAPLRYRIQAPNRSHWPSIYRKVVTLWRTQPHYSLDELGRIKASTLVVAGQFDIVKRQHTDQLASAIPHSEELIVQGSTHAVPTDKPEIVNRAILRFLDQGPPNS